MDSELRSNAILLDCKTQIWIKFDLYSIELDRGRTWFLFSQFQNANSTDLWTLFTQEARRTHTINSRMHVARIMRTWTQQPGHPLVTVERNADGTFQLTQVIIAGGNWIVRNWKWSIFRRYLSIRISLLTVIVQVQIILGGFPSRWRIAALWNPQPKINCR